MNLKATPVPNFALWKMGELNSNGARLFMALSHLSWSFSAVRFERLPASVFRDLVRLDHGGVRRGQAECVEAKLIQVEREEGRQNALATYTMLMPDGTPVKPLDGSPGVFRFNHAKWAEFLKKRSGSEQDEGEGSAGEQNEQAKSEQNAQGGLSNLHRGSEQNAHRYEQSAHTPLSQNVENSKLKTSKQHDKNSDEVKTLIGSGSDEVAFAVAPGVASAVEVDVDLRGAIPQSFPQAPASTIPETKPQSKKNGRAKIRVTLVTPERHDAPDEPGPSGSTDFSFGCNAPAIQKADETAAAPKPSEYAKSAERNRELRALSLGATLPFCGGPKPGDDLSAYGVQLAFEEDRRIATNADEATVGERARTRTQTRKGT